MKLLSSELFKKNSVLSKSKIPTIKPYTMVKKNQITTPRAKVLIHLIICNYTNSIESIISINSLCILSHSPIVHPSVKVVSLLECLM